MAFGLAIPERDSCRPIGGRVGSREWSAGRLPDVGGTARTCSAHKEFPQVPVDGGLDAMCCCVFSFDFC